MKINDREESDKIEVLHLPGQFPEAANVFTRNPNLDIARLRELAERAKKANPLGTHTTGEEWTFVLEVSPDVLLALLDRLETVRNAECGSCGRSLPPDGDCYGCIVDKMLAHAEDMARMNAADTIRKVRLEAVVEAAKGGCKNCGRSLERVDDAIAALEAP